MVPGKSAECRPDRLLEYGSEDLRMDGVHGCKVTGKVIADFSVVVGNGVLRPEFALTPRASQTAGASGARSHHNPRRLQLLRKSELTLPDTGFPSPRA